MYLLSHLFLMLTKNAEKASKERAEAYLADATDIYDLEFRMRKIDREAAMNRPYTFGSR
ncbi:MULTISPECIES: DUF3563 family protein [Burkholderia]|uniref:DUF3563 domain-containing protein n=2 Tax=Burkholderia lata (strain ATCC 17760 / DSM 23089 / LMG 22485 / NCIMB 9086 / R18194 / 383) TaxID=482957 RepID=A0A833PUU7_BURL3|nr:MULTISPECIES: DUF3563 family protein [Burkholderia]ABB12344.1 hypothetical protein Bcep18194_B2233 [Burkholderia lata]KAF1038406.1 MAG: hypothetical protein GAK33_02461 [Burkholderia lata]MBN3768487.1 DUF3563 domain-containing protein [Burkholderia sp. Se-20378]MBN3797866.1 DUF3563 domain-containing protein [Burkholderia sp. Ac-20392]MBN3827842.1 DUF3563 domain-containing protein [Burkholderia sp. Ac-20384]